MNNTICACGKEKAFDEASCPDCQERQSLEDREYIPEVSGASLNTPAEIIKAAIQGKVDLDKLEKLLTFVERIDANNARKAYQKAMAAFKANPPKIDEDKNVSFKTDRGTTSYNHASLGNVTEKINKELSKYGLSASWTTHQNGAVTVTCKITHELGHSEETTLSAAPDSSGSKNSIQAISSTITYLERYTLLALTGLAPYDQDDDGRGAEQKPEFITEKQVKNLLDLLAMHDIKEGGLVKYLQVEALETLPASEYQKAIVAIETQAKKKKEKSAK